ncbi:MAG: SDR family NAD(P)-dependent oxidoreductase, partial [Solirubrobacteraceae bacterium]
MPAGASGRRHARGWANAEPGRRALAARADVADQGEVVSMVEAAVGEFGRLGIVVNNAATTRFIPHRDLDALADEVCRRFCRRMSSGPSTQDGGLRSPPAVPRCDRPTDAQPRWG